MLDVAGMNDVKASMAMHDGFAGRPGRFAQGQEAHVFLGIAVASREETRKIIAMLARTGPDRHKGLSLFLVGLTTAIFGNTTVGISAPARCSTVSPACPGAPSAAAAQ